MEEKKDFKINIDELYDDTIVIENDEIFSDSSFNGKKKGTNKKMLIICSVCIFLAVLIIFYSAYRIILNRPVDGSGGIGTVSFAYDNPNKEKVMYALVCGFDDSEGRTDVLMLVMYDIEKQKVKVLQIPRDTYIGGGKDVGSAWSKINAVYMSGLSKSYCATCDKMLEKSEVKDGKHKDCGKKLADKKIAAIVDLSKLINDQFGIPIDHYATFTVEGFMSCVDLVGGVTVDVKQNVDYNGRYVKAGTHLLNGKDAEVFVRYRKGYINGDEGRVEAQRQLWSGVATKILDMTQMDFTTKILPKVYKEFSTDMTIKQLQDYKISADKIVVSDIEFYMLPGYSKTVGLSYYWVDKAEFVTLFNTQFNPYGKLLSAATITATEYRSGLGGGGGTTSYSATSKTSSKASTAASVLSSIVGSTQSVASVESTEPEEPDDTESEDPVTETSNTQSSTSSTASRTSTQSTASTVSSSSSTTPTVPATP